MSEKKLLNKEANEAVNLLLGKEKIYGKNK